MRVALIASATEENARVKEERATYGWEVVPGSRGAGGFWHVQGSGKSISMCCYVGKGMPPAGSPSLRMTRREHRAAEIAPWIARQPGADDCTPHVRMHLLTPLGSPLEWRSFFPKPTSTHGL